MIPYHPLENWWNCEDQKISDKYIYIYIYIYIIIIIVIRW